VATAGLFGASFSLENLERFAGGPVEAVGWVERLKPALIAADGATDCRFADALSPQYLLLTCRLADHKASLSGRNAA
jgi:hypothetical protein